MEAPSLNAELVSVSVADAMDVTVEMSILKPALDATRALAELQ
jgi:hypothetical protein